MTSAVQMLHGGGFHKRLWITKVCCNIPLAEEMGCLNPTVLFLHSGVLFFFFLPFHIPCFKLEFKTLDSEQTVSAVSLLKRDKILRT